MTESFVLRLVSHALADGRCVGEVEDVATGRSERVRSLDDLVRFIGLGAARTDARARVGRSAEPAMQGGEGGNA